jgi:hypothetical protein
MVVVPDHRAALGEFLHRAGIGKAFMRRHRAVDDAPEVRADLVGATLLDRMAGRALLLDGLAGGSIGGCQQHRDRHLRGRFRAATGCLWLGGFDDEAFLFRVGGGEDGVRDDADGKNNKHGPQEGADPLVVFE